MPELRWTLLLLGALFIAVLAWSERRKARQSTRSGHEPSIPDAPVSRPQREPTLRDREVTLTLPELRARDPSPPQDLPVVHVEDESLVGLRLDGPRVEASPRESAARSTDSQPAKLVTEWETSAAPDPSVPDLPVLAAAETAEFTVEAEASEVEAAQSPEPDKPMAPSVDWPPEEDRRIIALRLVSVSPERFSGRAIRTALVAEGFVHGKFSIFHKPDAQQRAVLSAASLSKPGVFDLETIDSQRFSGLNLFAVLSGGQPAREPFEMLLACARNLNERLEGGLQDDRGGPLTPSRIATLRESVGAAPAP